MIFRTKPEKPGKSVKISEFRHFPAKPLSNPYGKVQFWQKCPVGTPTGHTDRTGRQNGAKPLTKPHGKCQKWRKSWFLVSKMSVSQMSDLSVTFWPIWQFSCFSWNFSKNVTFWRSPLGNLRLLGQEKPWKNTTFRHSRHFGQKPWKMSILAIFDVLAKFGSQTRSISEKLSVLTGPKWVNKKCHFRQTAVLGRTLYPKEAWWTSQSPWDTRCTTPAACTTVVQPVVVPGVRGGACHGGAPWYGSGSLFPFVF